MNISEIIIYWCLVAVLLGIGVRGLEYAIINVNGGGSMLTPKFIHNDEEVVILSKSEYDQLLAELAEQKEKTQVMSRAFDDAYHQIEGKDDAVSFSDFKKMQGWP